MYEEVLCCELLEAQESIRGLFLARKGTRFRNSFIPVHLNTIKLAFSHMAAMFNPKRAHLLSNCLRIESALNVRRSILQSASVAREQFLRRNLQTP